MKRGEAAQARGRAGGCACDVLGLEKRACLECVWYIFCAKPSNVPAGNRHASSSSASTPGGTLASIRSSTSCRKRGPEGRDFGGERADEREGCDVRRSGLGHLAAEADGGRAGRRVADRLVVDELDVGPVDLLARVLLLSGSAAASTELRGGASVRDTTLNRRIEL